MTSSIPTSQPADRPAAGHPAAPGTETRSDLVFSRRHRATPGLLGSRQGRTGRNAWPVRPDMRHAVWLVLAAAAAAPVAASGPDVPARPTAWQAQADVPPLRHESAFSTYRPHVDTAVGDWRATNQTVNRIGGWRAYGREAGAPLQPLPPLHRDGTRPAGSPPPATAAPPARHSGTHDDASEPARPGSPAGAAGHGGHGTHHPSRARP
jgi:hypothetical protein